MRKHLLEFPFFLHLNHAASMWGAIVANVITSTTVAWNALGIPGTETLSISFPCHLPLACCWTLSEASRVVGHLMILVLASAASWLIAICTVRPNFKLASSRNNCFLAVSENNPTACMSLGEVSKSSNLQLTKFPLFRPINCHWFSCCLSHIVELILFTNDLWSWLVMPRKQLH